MILSHHILQKIITDLDFSRDLSAVLGIKQSSVEATAKRAIRSTSRPISLTKPEAIRFYKEEGYTEDQIFEKEEQPVT